MIGKKFTKPQRVVLMVLDVDGRQHAIEIFDGTCDWSYTGHTDDGQAQGRVVATGNMHRRILDAVSNPVLEVEAGARESES